MNRHFSYYLLIAFLLTSFSLSAQKQGTLRGKINNNKFEKIDIVSGSNNNNILVSGIPIQDDGTFSATLSIAEPDILRLSLNDKDYFLSVFYPGEKMYLEFDANNLSQVDSVSGSKSMVFVKDVTDLLAEQKTLLASINQNLKKDEIPVYYNNFNKEFSPFQQINKEIDQSLIKAITTHSILNDLVTRFSNDNKLISSKIDSLLLLAPEMLKTINDSYQPFNNYRQNIRSNYHFPGDRIKDDDAFHADIVEYMTILDDRYQLIGEVMDEYVQEIAILAEKRDSLVYNGLLNNKKSKTILANTIANTVKKYNAPIAEANPMFIINAQISETLSHSIFSTAQSKVNSVVAIYQNQYNKGSTEINNRIQSLLLANKEDLAVVMLIDIFPKEQNLELHTEVLGALYQKYPNNPIVKERYRIISSPEVSTAIGAIAPELEFLNPDGQMMKLSSLRGKYVLIDFWASWCGPCRKENPNVVRMYQKYKDKGFEIYSVSLDRDKASWVKAIEADNLSWPNHVSDLKYWQSEGAKIYGVSSIPATFLIGPDGKIIAKNIRGNQLSNTLEQIFNK